MRTRFARRLSACSGARRDRDVVEEAEAHGAVRPRRGGPAAAAARSRCRAVRPRLRRRASMSPPAARARRERGVAAGVRVGIELDELVPRGRRDRVEVRAVWIRSSSAPVASRAAHARGSARRAPPPRGAEDRRQPAGMLRMLVGRAMQKEALVEDEPGRHFERRSKRRRERRRTASTCEPRASWMLIAFQRRERLQCLRVGHRRLAGEPLAHVGGRPCRLAVEPRAGRAARAPGRSPPTRRGPERD